MYRVIASFTDAEKFRFIESVWKPDVLFEFPASKETCGKQRKFRQEWLVKYPWLVYSKYLDGAFCLPCVCFGVECGKNGAKLDKLFRSPLTFWTTARGKFDSHASGKSEIHKFSVMAMQNFLAAMRRQTAPIDQQLNQLMQAQIDENREKMKSIVKTVIFCGQNNIPLRGKRDDNPDDSNLQGNFQALLEFRIDSGDVKVKEHIENLNLTLVKNTHDMLNIIFKKCFLVSVGQEKLLNFVDLNQIFIVVLILNIFPNMHQIALRSIQISGGTCPRTPLASSGLRPSISSLMEKFILVETSHEKCWIHPC